MDSVFAENGNPLVRGTPEEIVTWLEANDEFSYRFWIHVGETSETLTASQYLRRF